MSIPQIALGFLLSGLIAYLSSRVRALTAGGGWAATLVGGLIFGLGGLSWAVLLFGFFLSSSVLSHAFGEHKRNLKENFAKGPKRDAVQVLANGGMGAGLVLMHTLFPEQPWIAYAGTMGAVNADTWATELGVLSPQTPRLITSGRRVERGISGGITLLGTISSLAGALLIALLAGLFNPLSDLIKTLMVIGAAGLVGSLFDSLLGATLQAIYFCPQCRVETECYPIHHCSHHTKLSRGWGGMNNDMVNLISSVFGAAVAIGLWWII